jgi:hypothetical protein
MFILPTEKGVVVRTSFWQTVKDVHVSSLDAFSVRVSQRPDNLEEVVLAVHVAGDATRNGIGAMHSVREDFRTTRHMDDCG